MLPTAGCSAPSRPDAAFRRRSRLLQPAQFKRVFDGACRLGGSGVLILARRNDLGYPRLGMAISRKVARRAVVRNRIKRQVRETFRLAQDEIGPFDIVVLGRPGVDRLSKSELRAILHKHWRALPERCRNSSSP